MIFLLVYFFTISHTLSGCNNIHPITKKSTCFENWQKRENLKLGLQCCLSNEEASLRKFDVPVIMVHNFTPFNFKCLRSRDEQQCKPKLKCLPKNLRDLHDFFNFLDLLRSIPFETKNDHSNWHCFNTVDNFDIEKLLSNQKRLKTNSYLALKNHLRKNFCRTLLFKYITTHRTRVLQKDLCENIDKIAPFHKGQKPKRFGLLNPLKQIIGKLCWLDKSSKLICSYDSQLYIQTQMTTSIPIFTNHYNEWRELGISIQKDMYFFCGCFIR